MNNIYYDPEKFGLTIIGDIEWGSGCYEFDQTVVFRKQDGSLAYAEDSGCSCPCPFDYMGVDDLTPVTVAELQAHLEERSKSNWNGDRAAEIAEIMGKVV